MYLHCINGSSVCLQFLVSFPFQGDPKRRYYHYQQTTLLLTGQRELKHISVNWIFPSVLGTHYAQCLTNPCAAKLIRLPWSWEHSLCIMQNTAKPRSGLLELHLSATLQKQMQSTHISPRSLNHCWIGVCQTDASKWIWTLRESVSSLRPLCTQCSRS